MRHIRTYAAMALLVGAAAISSGPAPTSAAEESARVYQVTVTNLASGQLLSPPLLATHTRDFGLFAVGDRAIEGIWVIAERGDNSVLAGALSDHPEVAAVVAADMPVHRIGGPGASSMTLTIESRGAADRLSIATMLGCTNDGFTGLSAVELSRSFVAATYYAGAYDAGTEENNQLHSHIPDGCVAVGPVSISGDGMNQRMTTEGVITMHPGIRPGLGDLTEAHGWADPIVKITIQRVE